ncbi:2,3-bisphosphoglycerate-independent phosphoglycerate mutase [Clostridiales bacterium CHKCI006]|uniref:2,3-bisphosphoglycerate-independent phosphoglycerate mutase n=1 Tax=Candidatus Fimiplasma intestinipullorum TaxID=2840825 RepID=A0A9D1HPD5_9FIRM|nr:2,3-bisphosphoglycerate-independent phosphoglycerate mutase [Clostridiales bacterium CHKCI006]HIU14076.1 2,3-bisphosphoglycerate-independent phosphoglycerate mutase [Candidatus Fimiplasma intestinipullorum]
MKKRPVVLCILDGYGLRDELRGNAVRLANTPNLDDLMATYPTTTIDASGMAVGLPNGQMGNSEVGHMNIGAGRIVYQSLTLINKAVEDGTFFTNEKLLGAMEHAKKHDSKLHIWGLLSNGGVHSSIEHIFALLQMAKKEGLSKVYVHAFLDGRDVAPDSGAGFVKEIVDYMNELGVGELYSISGRYYAMDRDKRWDRIELAYNNMVKGEGKEFSDPVAYVEASYKEEVFDEFVIPGHSTTVPGTIEDNDAIIFANFRPDRAIQMSSVITNDEYLWQPSTKPKNIAFVCMMKYADTVNGEIAFALPKLTNTLGDYLSSQGLKQLRIAETEKYAHVTFFLDGGVDKEIEGATRVLVNSPKVATYDLQPEMSAYEVKDKLLEELDKDVHDVIIVNFANCDMVGHTGVIPAAIKAVSVVDECVGEIYDKVFALGGTMLITADHGNSEMLLDEDGNPFTAHTTNKVPLIVTNTHLELVEGGKLGDLAPTILTLLGLPIPEEMTGNVLVK